MQDIKIPGPLWPIVYMLVSTFLIENFGYVPWVVGGLGAVAVLLKAYGIIVEQPEEPQAYARQAQVQRRSNPFVRFWAG